MLQVSSLRSQRCRPAHGPHPRLLWPILKDFLIQRRSLNLSWKISISRCINCPRSDAHSTNLPLVREVWKLGSSPRNASRHTHSKAWSQSAQLLPKPGLASGHASENMACPRANKQCFPSSCARNMLPAFQLNSKLG